MDDRDEGRDTDDEGRKKKRAVRGKRKRDSDSGPASRKRAVTVEASESGESRPFKVCVVTFPF